MEESFIYQTGALVLIIVLLFLMIGLIYAGRKIGVMQLQREGKTGNGGPISSMFGLMAFLLAFTFGMSASRYDTRRENIVKEANALGTAILRSDLYPELERKAFREDFKQYLEDRIRYFDEGPSVKKDIDYGKKLWDRAARLSHDPAYLVASQQMVPALNEMLDSDTTRLIGELSRVPDSIVWMLFVLALASAFYLGYGYSEKRLDWLVAIGFCVLTSVVIFITLDLDRPRRGLIQLSTPHHAMLELRKMF